MRDSIDLEKKALIVGIDDYKSRLVQLTAVYDAERVYEVLSRNDDMDESPNFDCKLLTSPPDEVKRVDLRAHIENFFMHKADVALFYFAGHGTIDRLGGYLATEDYERYDPGVSMADLLTLANESKLKTSRLITLRKCKPFIERPILRLLTKSFPKSDDKFDLDPSFEPTAKLKNKKNEKIFGHLQKFRAARLLEPVDAEHMYDAAMKKKLCKLTPLAQFYWRLADDGKI